MWRCGAGYSTSRKPSPALISAPECILAARMTAGGTAAPRRILHGRRRGRALRPGQRRLLDTNLPLIRVALPEAGMLEPGTLFARPVESVWLELGFGGGEHLAAQAASHPAIGMLGAEVFENGIAKLLAEIARLKLANIRIFGDDGRLLLDALAPASIARAFILFPDPWPKERHKKRRLVSPATLDALARAMTDGAELRLATDVADYAQAMMECATSRADFRPLGEWPAHGRDLVPDWPPTRYEQKALAAGRKPVYLRLLRVRERAP
jgi:tRNA (guanine-N7-)-methyltransferase